jgi:nucleoside-diphosphate-sugar epimerase
VSLLIFGYGYTAAVCSQYLMPRFERVYATVRTPQKADLLREKVIEAHVFTGEHICAPLRKAMQNSAVWLISIPPLTADFAPSVAVDPVLDVLHQHGTMADFLHPKTLIYLSTVGVYGDHQGAWVTEQTLLRPQSKRSLARLAAEAAWQEFADKNGFPLFILRLSGIYGAGRSAVENIKQGTAKRLVKPNQVFNRIHVTDIARAVAAAIDQPEQAGIYNVTDDLPAPPQDVVAYAAQLLGVPPPPEQAFDPDQLSPMAVSFYAENKRVSNQKLKENLKMQFQYPTYREGIAALVADDDKPIKKDVL